MFWDHNIVLCNIGDIILIFYTHTLGLKNKYHSGENST